MFIGSFPDALTIVKVAHALSDTYPAQLVEIYEGVEPVGTSQTQSGKSYAAQLVELYEDADLIGTFQMQRGMFVRGYYLLETATHKIRALHQV